MQLGLSQFELAVAWVLALEFHAMLVARLSAGRQADDRGQCQGMRPELGALLSPTLGGTFAEGMLQMILCMLHHFS